MKRIFKIAIIALALLWAVPAMAITTYNCDALTGGVGRALDALSDAVLEDNDRAVVQDGGVILRFYYDAADTSAENVATHPYKVRPDDYNVGVWIELPYGYITSATAAATGVVELATNAETVTGTDTERATTPANITAKMSAPGAIGDVTPGPIIGTTIATSGANDMTIANGNLVIGTSGKGIDFSATGQAAGITSELLDDYEEGTFTPVFADASTGGNVAGGYLVQLGTYTKTGRLVTITIKLFNIDTTGMTGGNVAHIRGLPFTVGFDCINAAWTGNVTIAQKSLFAILGNTETWATVSVTQSAGVPATLTVADFTDDQADIKVTLAYTAS